MTLDVGIASTPGNSYITDITTLFALERGGWLSASTWVALLGALGIASSSARMALHRMTKAGFLERQAREGRAGYAVSASWVEFLDRVSDGSPLDGAGDLASGADDDEWVLLTFSVPESKRAERHVMRTTLSRNGFAPLGNGTWLASAKSLDNVRVHLEAGGLAGYVDMFTAKYQGFGEPTELVERCWDINAIADRYRDFIRGVRSRLKRRPGPDARTFTDVVVTKNSWRRINFDDPHLPGSALPARWPREEATRLAHELLDGSLDFARRFVDSVDTI